jgi:hypothetical protein
VWRGRSFPAFSKPGLLRLIFGTGFRETPIFGPQGNLLRGFDPRNIAFKLRRRLFGIGRLEIAAALRVQGGRGAAEAGGAPLTIRFPGPAVPVLLK